MVDWEVSTYGIQQISSQTETDKPLFLALGYRKPHLPWIVPQKYFDMFPLESIKLPTVLDNDIDDLPPEARRVATRREYHDLIEATPLLWEKAVRGYLASIAFLDEQIGRVLDAFEKSAIRNNTIVIFMSDHGYHLGQKQHWMKSTLWEEGTRIPYIWFVPNLTRAGTISSRTMDLMSLYPTLMDLCGIPKPPHVVGESIVPLLGEPDATWNTPAITTKGQRQHAVRNETWRYIEYMTETGKEIEVYDELMDPLEWANLASTSRGNDVAATLQAHLIGIIER